MIPAESDTGQNLHSIQGREATIDVAKWHLDCLFVPQAWEISRGSPQIKVAIIDTGFDLGHPALIPNLLPGWDFDDEDNQPIPNPRITGAAHGTACAGLVAAVQQAADGAVGVAPEVSIVPIRLQMRFRNSTKLQRAIEFAAGQASIILCPWITAPDQFVTETIGQLAMYGRGGKGIPIICAAGNGSQAYPACLRETIAVGACTDAEQRADYSPAGARLDFLAPSSGGRWALASTDLRGAKGYNRYGDYTSPLATGAAAFGGTSAAAALAAGVAALVLSVRPDLSLCDLRTILQRTARKIDARNANYHEDGWSSSHGYGCLDAKTAVFLAKQWPIEPREIAL